MPVGAQVTVTVSGAIAPGVNPSESLANTATVRFTSLDDNVPSPSAVATEPQSAASIVRTGNNPNSTERTGTPDDDATGNVNDYVATGTVAPFAATPLLTKLVVDTSEPGTIQNRNLANFGTNPGGAFTTTTGTWTGNVVASANFITVGGTATEAGSGTVTFGTPQDLTGYATLAASVRARNGNTANTIRLQLTDSDGTVASYDIVVDDATLPPGSQNFATFFADLSTPTSVVGGNGTFNFAAVASVTFAGDGGAGNARLDIRDITALRTLVAPGEVVRYRLIFQLPEGQSPDLQLRDAIPAGLQFLNDGTSRAVFLSNNPIGGITSDTLSGGTLAQTGNQDNLLTFNMGVTAGVGLALPDLAVSSSNTTNNDAYGNGTGVIFKLGNLLNTDNDVDSEYVMVEFNVLVVNAATNQAGVRLGNTFSAFLNGSSASPTQIGSFSGGGNPTASAISDNNVLVVVEPQITNLLKTVTGTPPVDAGDNLAYQIAFSNSVSHPATDAPSVRAATTANLGTGFAANQITGVALASGNLVVDGVTLAINDRVLVKNQTTAAQNGLFKVTDINLVTGLATLTRATDFDTAVEVTFGYRTFVIGGTANGGRTFEQSTAGAITLNTTAINWQQASVNPAVRASTTANLGGFSAGTFTGVPAAIDGVTLAVGDRVLVKNQAAAAQNGVYVVSVLGTLVRAGDFDQTADFPVGVQVAVTAGAIGIGRTYALSAAVPTVNTSAVNWSAVDEVTAYEVALADAIPAGLEFQSVTITTPYGTYTGTVSGAFTGGTITVPAVGASGLITVNLDKLDPESRLSGPTRNVTITVNTRVANTAPAGLEIPNSTRVTYTGLPASGTTPNSTGSTNGASGTGTGERTGQDVPTPTDNTSPTFSAALNNYSVGSTALTTLAVPTIDKRFQGGSLTADDTSVAGTTGSNVAVGESIVYDLFVRLPEGVTQGLVLRDVLPSGLRLDTSFNGGSGFQIITSAAASNGQLAADFSDPASIASPTLAAFGAGTLGTDGTDFQLTFGNVTVTPDGSATNDAFLVRVRAIVTNVASNQANATLTNVGSLAFTNPNTGATDVRRDETVTDADGSPFDPTVTVVEPVVTVTKTASPLTADAGDTITYSITIANLAANGSGADAYDVSFADVLPSQLLIGPAIGNVLSNFTGPIAIANFQISDFAEGGAPNNLTTTGSGFTLLLGQTATFQITGTLSNTVNPGGTVSNTATSQYTSTPGANPDERTGVDGPGGPLNDYASSSTAATTAINAGPTVTKSLFTTSLASTAGTDVTIAETVTYALKVTLPEGTTPSFTLTDILPPGLQYLSTSLVTTAAASGGLLSSNFNGTVPSATVTGGVADGDDATFNFGQIVVNGDNDPTTNSFLILVNAKVTNVAGNVGLNPPGRTSLPNSATFDAPGDGVAPGTTNTITVQVVEPRVTVTKNIVQTTADAGDALVILLSVTNTGTSDAYDVIVRDPLNPTFFDATAVNFGTAGTEYPADFTPSVDTATGLVLYSGGTVPVGQSRTFTFTVPLTGNVTPTQIITNTANVPQATSMPGPVPGERNTTAGPVSDTVSVPNGQIAKAISGTSLVGTTGSNVAVGEVITYTLTVTLPEGTTPSLTITDALPAGVVFVPGSVIVNTTGFGGTVGTESDSIAGNTLTIQFATPITVNGDNNGGNNSFTIGFQVTVANVVGNEGILPGQTALPNAATMQAGASPSVTSPPVPATVVEPQLQILKSVLNPDTTIDAGTNVNYRLVISHSANSTGPAYNVRLGDPLDPIGMVLTSLLVGGGATDITVSAPGYTTVLSNLSNANGLDLTFSELRPGDTITVTYRATLRGPAAAPAFVPAPGSTVTNTATTLYATAPLGGRNEPPLTSTAAFTVNTNSIAGVVYQDSNNDGIRQLAEPLIAGQPILIRLTGTDAQGNAVNRTITTNDGTYNFLGVRPGTYAVAEETQPTGFVDGRDTAGTPFGGNNSAPLAISTITNVVVPADSNVAGIDYNFGELLPASLGNFVWEDLNGNGIQDGGELGIVGIAVALNGTDAFGNVVTASTTTTAGGAYLFGNLLPGSYTVTFGNTVGATTYTRTVQNSTVPGATAANDSDGNPATGTTASIALGQGQSRTDIDQGLYIPITIGDAVFYDTNNSGTQQAGEPGIPNVAVNLLYAGPDGTFGNGDDTTFTATTNASGIYNFNGPPGSYRVSVNTATLPSGATTATTVVTQPTTLNSGQSDLNRDFGYRGIGTLGDRVFLDVNANGVYDPGEGLDGVIVNLSGDLNGNGTPETLTTTTAADGFYQFANLRTGTPGTVYTVTIVPSTLPKTGAGTPIPNTVDPDGGTPNTSVTTLTTALPSNQLQDFGYRGPGEIGDTIFLDVNNNGVPNPGEGIAGVSVTLTGDVDGDGTPDTFTTTTNAPGIYDFSNLPVRTPSGTLIAYSVSVNTTTLPAGVANTTDPDGGTLNQSTLTLTPATPVNLAQDFGYRGPGAIGDRVFLDVNGNGTFDAGEGLAGVIVALTADVDGDGTTSTVTTTTDGDGFYQFGGLPIFRPNGTTAIPYAVSIATATLPRDGAGNPIANTVDPDGGTANASTLTLSAASPSNQAQDFGYRGPGEIGDTIFLDVNANGVPNAGEGIAGAVVTLTADVDGDGTPESFVRTTNNAGIYDFSNLPVRTPAGTLIVYAVSVNPSSLPAGVTNTVDPDGGTANQSTLTLTPATPINLNQDFGYRGPGSIGDRVFLDINNNGTYDVGEGLDNVAVTLTADVDGNGTPSTVTATTGPDGFYTFSGLPVFQPNGTTAIPYTVAVVTTTLPAGVANTTDPDGGTLNQSTLTLTPATPVNLAQDFGYRGPGAIGDRVFLDVNGNGTFDAGEGLAGVIVALTADVDGDGTTSTVTTTTDGDGFYQFGGLPIFRPNGTTAIPYAVSIATATLPRDGAGNPIANTVDPDGGTANASTLTLSAASPSNQAQDFGYRGPGEIGDTIFLDVNANGVPNAGEGIAGAVVTLTADVDGDGTPESFVRTTNNAGIYDFSNLPVRTPAGTLIVYAVSVNPSSLPAGVTNTVDPDGGTANQSTLTLTPATPINLNQDFGYRGPGSIGDRVFLDINNNGTYDVGEGLDNVAVTLTADVDGNGTPSTVTATTGPDGFYTFSGLPVFQPNGTTAIPYTVAVNTATLPAGLSITTDPDGGVLNQSTLTLDPAQPTNVVQDFGYRGPGSIGDRVFLDLNGNGTFDAGEGLSGITVSLTADVDGTTSTVTTTTDADGFYQFTGLPIRRSDGESVIAYTVAVVTATLPTGVTNTVDPDGGNDNLWTGDLTANPNRTDVDFGYRGTGSLGDFVWIDSNGNGFQGTAALEPGLPGVGLVLTWAGPDGTFGNADDVTGATTTTAAGAYRFGNLPPGFYRVAVTPSTLPTNVVPTFDLDGIATPNVASAIALANGQNRTDADFGYRGTASVGDRVWIDQNGDGVQNPSEPGIPGRTVTLTWSGPDGTLGNADDVTFVTTTGANGIYTFPGLPVNGASDPYSVSVAPPAGFVPTFDLDSVATPNVAGFNLGSAETKTDVDFGYRGTASIAGFVYRDDSNDGLKNGTEPGILGATLTLTGTDAFGNAVLDPATGTPFTTITGAGGAYSFGNLPPGTYTITETQPAGYSDGLDTAGNLGGTAGNDAISAIPVGPGQAGTAYNFGERGPSISGSVYRDNDRTGVRGPTEVGIGAVTITLQDSGVDGIFGNEDDGASRTTTTANDGSYRFDNNAPFHNYRIVETQPITYLDSPRGPTTLIAVTNLQAVGSSGNDFGEVGGSLAGSVYVDVNANATRDPGEVGLNGVTIALTGTDLLGNPVAATAITGADGSYLFPNLPAGTYVVVETQPTPYRDGQDAAGTAGGTVTNDQIGAIPLAAGQNATGYLFGEVGPNAVSGFVYLDFNLDGSRTLGGPNPETGLAGIPIALSGADEDGRPVNRTTTTDSAGFYRFTDLAAGTYTIVETQPGKPVSLAQGVYDGGESIGSLGGTIPAKNQLRVTVTGNATNPQQNGIDYNFGELPPADPFGFVYEDVNNNGIREPGEPGIAGIPITLSGTAFAGTPFARPLVASDLPGNSLTVVTDANGRWEFLPIPPGLYTITESTQPAGFLDGREQVADPNPPATVVVGNDIFSNVVLAPFPVRGPFNFGEIRASSLAGNVYFDENRNGTRDGIDTGIGGVALVLTGTDDLGSPVSLATTTNANGDYSFAGLRPGNYAVAEAQPVAFAQGTNAIGTAGGQFVGTDITGRIVLGAGNVATGYNFGEVRRSNTRSDPVPALPPLPPLTTIAPGLDPDVSKRQFLGSTTGTATTARGSDTSVNTQPNYSALGSLGETKPNQFLVTSEGANGELVRVFDLTRGQERFRLRPFPGNPGGTRAISADINGDGVPDIIAVAGPGGAPRVIVYDGNNGAVVQDFFAFETSYRGGLFVAAADFDRDGRADLILTPDEGGGARVRILSAGNPDRVIADFFGIDDPAFRGGARAAAGDLNGDGTPDLIVSAGFGGGPRVAVFDGADLSRKLTPDFFAFEQTLRNGVYLAAGDVDGDGIADLILGAGPGGGPRVLTVSGRSLIASGGLVPLGDFFAGPTTSRTGVNVSARDVNGDGLAEVVAGSAATELPVVRFYNARSGALLDQFYAQYAEFAGGVFVG